MKIIQFNRTKGIYSFEVPEIASDFHTHPVVEILYSSSGKIKIETPDSIFEANYFAIIDANIAHRVACKEGVTNILMIECSSAFLQETLRKYDISLDAGVYVESVKNNGTEIIKELSHLYEQGATPIYDDTRIQSCLDYLNSSASDYKQMLPILKAKTSLSESRLSHLFKDKIGVSLKKYMVWSRLKRAFELVLTTDINMYEAALQSGFYDQAHLSKAFKQMLGINPSEVYNSRMIQD